MNCFEEFIYMPLLVKDDELVNEPNEIWSRISNML